MTDINQLKMTEQEQKDLEKRIRRRESYERVELATNKILTLLVEDGLTIKEGEDALSKSFRSFGHKKIAGKKSLIR